MWKWIRWWAMLCCTRDQSGNMNMHAVALSDSAEQPHKNGKLCAPAFDDSSRHLRDKKTLHSIQTICWLFHHNATLLPLFINSFHIHQASWNWADRLTRSDHEHPKCHLTLEQMRKLNYATMYIGIWTFWTYVIMNIIKNSNTLRVQNCHHLTVKR